MSLVLWFLLQNPPHSRGLCFFHQGFYLSCNVTETPGTRAAPVVLGPSGNVRSCDDSGEVMQHTRKNASTHGHKRRLYASHCMLFVSRHELLSRELTRDLLRVDPAGSPENILMSNRCRVLHSHKRSTVCKQDTPTSERFGPVRTNT